MYGSLHSLSVNVFGIGIKTTLHRSFGHSSLLQMIVHKHYSVSTPSFPDAFRNSAGMSSFPGNFPFLIWFSASNISEGSSSSVLSGQYVCASYSFVLFSIYRTPFYLLCFSQCIAILIIYCICACHLLVGHFFTVWYIFFEFTLNFLSIHTFPLQMFSRPLSHP